MPVEMAAIVVGAVEYRLSMVSLRPVNESNREAVEALEVAPDQQQFVSNAADSIREAAKEPEIDGLGDEAWLLRTETNGTEVTYHWRRSNLVVEAHVHCLGFCPGDVDAAARAWVDAIDKAARAGS
jgi:hypothetical protein